MVIDTKTYKPLHALTENGKERYDELMTKIEYFKAFHPILSFFFGYFS